MSLTPASTRLNPAAGESQKSHSIPRCWPREKKTEYGSTQGLLPAKVHNGGVCGLGIAIMLSDSVLSDRSPPQGHSVFPAALSGPAIIPMVGRFGRDYTLRA